jgi:cytochrome P450
MFRVAGADTVAVSTTLTLHYVLSIPKVQDRLSMEIRSKFDKSEDITGQSTAMLPYLGAVIQEGASSFDLFNSRAANPPVVTASPPRVTPPEGMIIEGKFIRGGVITPIPSSSYNRR